MTPALFTGADADRAHDTWGANCGPAALAAVLGITLDQVRPHMGDFERKGYTNPTLMFAALKSAGAAWRRVAPIAWPDHGLVRVQWEGPWTAPGVPTRARYRHSHWVAANKRPLGWWIFDVNCLSVGGWVSVEEWSASVVPWLLKACEPKANGKWHPTHVLEVTPPAVAK